MPTAWGSHRVRTVQSFGAAWQPGLPPPGASAGAGRRARAAAKRRMGSIALTLAMTRRSRYRTEHFKQSISFLKFQVACAYAYGRIITGLYFTHTWLCIRVRPLLCTHFAHFATKHCICVCIHKRVAQ
jgi:hypothetical protein